MLHRLSLSALNNAAQCMHIQQSGAMLTVENYSCDAASKPTKGDACLSLASRVCTLTALRAGFSYCAQSKKSSLLCVAVEAHLLLVFVVKTTLLAMITVIAVCKGSETCSSAACAATIWCIYIHVQFARLQRFELLVLQIDSTVLGKASSSTNDLACACGSTRFVTALFSSHVSNVTVHSIAVFDTKQLAAAITLTRVKVLVCTLQ
eukprot:15042-Heterococcus_DN1.PRE.2